MRTPNYFKRDGSVLSWGYFDVNAETIERDDFSDISRVNTPFERFEDVDGNGDPITNAYIQLWVGSLLRHTVKAFDLWIDVNGTPLQTTNLDEIIDFFFNP